MQKNCFLAIIVSAQEEDGIKKVTTYLTENFDKKISLEEMADMAGLSPYHFNRKYKKETGVTPYQFLLSTRISAAKYSLSECYRVSPAFIAAFLSYMALSAFLKTSSAVTSSSSSNMA